VTQAVDQLETVITITGLAVWAIVLAFYVFGSHYLSLRPDPIPGRIRLRISHVIAPFFVFILAIWVMSIASVHVTFAETDKIDALARQLVCSEAGKIAAAVLMVILIWRVRVIEGLFARRKSLGIMRVACLAAVIYLAIYPLVNRLLNDLGLVFCDQVLKIHIQPTHPAIMLLDHRATAWAIRLIVLLSVIVISPVTEELFFRGFVQNYCLKRIGHAWPAIVLASLAFMIAHVQMPHHCPALFALSVILGWSYYHYRTIWVPVAVHILFNAVTMAFWAMSWA